jgi:hypothetical protein
VTTFDFYRSKTDDSAFMGKTKKVREFKTSFTVSAGSLAPLKLILTTFVAIISANTKPFAKRL